MAKVRYTIRLYRLHDLDLITFIFTHEFDIMHAIYSATKAFAKGEAFLIKIPPNTNETLPQLRRVYTKTLVLDTKKDKDAIAMIDRIQPGKRNNFFKNLLRLYLMYPFSECFFERREDLQYFEEKLKVFRVGQREVRAGKVKKQNFRTVNEELSSSKEERAEKEASPVPETTEPDILPAPQEFVPESSAQILPPADKSEEPAETGYVAEEETPEEVSGDDESAILSIFNDLM